MKSYLNRLVIVLIYNVAFWVLPPGWLMPQTYGQVERTCRTRGTLLAQGQNSVPTGKLKVKTYSLDTTDNRFFCLNVSLDSPINGTYLVWINDDPIAAHHLRRGELTAAFSLQWLENGATISVSEFSTPYEITSLREKLKLPESVLKLRETHTAGFARVTTLRRVTHNVDGAPKPFIVVVIKRSEPFYPIVASNTWVIQIGRKEFFASTSYGDPHTLACIMTPEQFAQVKDGDLVRVNWGFGALPHGQAGKSFARFDKKMLDKGK